MKANLAILFDDPQGDQSKPNPEADNGYRIISVRLRSGEYQAFVQQVAALGLTHNMALRVAARRIGGFLEADGVTRHKLEQISSHIGEISAAVSRLHKTAARCQAVDMTEFERQRQAFGQEFAELDCLLQQILNISRRRQDGKRLLLEAS